MVVQGGVPGVVGGGVVGGDGGGEGAAPAGLLHLLLKSALQQLLGARVVEVIAVHPTQGLHKRHHLNITQKSDKFARKPTRPFQYLCVMPEKIPVRNARHLSPDRRLLPPASPSDGTCRPA